MGGAVVARTTIGAVPVTLENLGAWLLKGNADRAGLVERFAHEPRVTRWCVHPTYRVALMAAGQPVLFWGSGSRRRDLPYGVWGFGQVTGPVRDGEVPLDLTIGDPGEWIGRDVLRAEPGLRDLEVLRQPQAGNPSYVTPEQLAIIERLRGRG